MLLGVCERETAGLSCRAKRAPTRAVQARVKCVCACARARAKN